MNDEELRAAYRGWLDRQGTGAAPARPTPGEIAAVVAREGTEAERLAALDAIMRARPLEREFAYLAAVRSAAEGAEPSRVRGGRLLVAAAVAAVAVGGALLLRQRPAADDLVRGDVRTQPAPRADGLLAWPRDSAADDYVIEFTNAGGDSVAAVVTRDTVLARDAVPGAAAATAWRVIVQRGDGTRRSSAIHPLGPAAP